MYRKRPNLLLGFHGCDLSVSEQIRSDIDEKGFSDYKQFDSARGIFTEGGPIFEGVDITISWLR
jgi:hypothetical protein